MKRHAWWRLAQVFAVAAVLFYVVRRISAQWASLSALPGAVDVNWALLGASGAVVLGSYGVLIWTWQRTVLAWGERLGFREAGRIWFISNLGRYVPGKVWQIGAMGMMAQRAGVSPVAAVGSSLVISVVNVLVGVAITASLGAGSIAASPLALGVTALLVAGVVAAPWLLPRSIWLAGRVLRRELRAPELPHSAIWVAAAGCGVAWLLYGVAFRLLHVALLGHATGGLAGSTAAFTGSYIAGFLFLPAPGGIGVREDFLQRLLQQFGIADGAEAWFVVLASRAWLTLLEVAPGLTLLLISRSKAGMPTSTPE